jgi:AcrR family transcriptional regulator
LGKRDQNRIEQRERILDSARMLFATVGFEQTTVSDIARSAGVARATVFNYFASKHALVDAITEEVLAHYGRMLERALADQTSSTPDLLRALYEHMALGIEGVQDFYRGVFREIAKMQLGLDEGGAAAVERELCVGRMEALMRRGQERGEIRAQHEPRDLAYAFDSLSNGTLVNWLYDNPSKSLPDRMGRAIEIFLGGVATTPNPRGDAPLPDLGE